MRIANIHSLTIDRGRKLRSFMVASRDPSTTIDFSRVKLDEYNPQAGFSIGPVTEPPLKALKKLVLVGSRFARESHY